MKSSGKPSRRKKAVGSIIGAVFLVLIILSGFTFYQLYLNIADHYNGTLQSIGESDWSRNREKIVINNVEITGSGNLSVTVENEGTLQSHLIWFGIFNMSASPETQAYYPLDISVDPAETKSVVSVFTVTQGNKYAVQLVTELGNTIGFKFYPASQVRCQLTLTTAPPTAYKGNNVTVALTVTHNDSEVDAIQSLTVSLSPTPSGLVQLMDNSSLTARGLRKGESAFFWWVYSTIGTGTAILNATYGQAPVGVYVTTSLNVLDSPGQGGAGTVSITGVNCTVPYNPSQWNLLGSTANMSGSISDLVINDSSYAVFRSYYTGTITDINDFVDNNSSDVDGSANKGTQSNFTAQQHGPDSINDTLTEANPTVLNNAENFVDANTSDIDGHVGYGTSSNFTAQQDSNVLYNDTLTEALTSGGTSDVFTSGFEVGVWSSQWDGNGAPTFQRGTSSTPGSPWTVHGGTNMSYSTGTSTYTLISDDIDLSGATSAGISFWYMNDDNEGTDFLLYFYNGSTYNLIYDLGSVDPEDAWLHYSATITDVQYLKSNFRIEFTAAPDGPSGAEKGFVDDVVVNKTVPNNYEMDYEFSWTTADYDEANEYLCIRTNSFAGTAENLGVDVWTGTPAAWVSISSALNASQWNNISISSYLNQSTMYFRFIGKTESSDTAQNTWVIECNLVHTWSAAVNYELDIEERFTSVDTGAYTNKELCIFAGTWSTSETLKVDVWNTTSSSWVTVIASLTKNAWNNVSIANLLTATVTIRFHDGAETNDTVQDSWDIDVSLLHLWTQVDQYTAEVEFTGSSKLQNWTSLLWQIQSCWNVTQVAVTIQFYNFTLGNYTSTGSGYFTYMSSPTANINELQSKTENSSPNDFKNSTGHWRVKITGVKSISTPFLMKIDWIDLQTTYSTTGDTIPYNACQLYSIKATTTSGGPIPYAYVSIYANGTLVRFRNVTDKVDIGNPAWVRLDAGGQFMLEIKSANGSGETFVLYAVVGSIVGQKTVTQEAP